MAQEETKRLIEALEAIADKLDRIYAKLVELADEQRKVTDRLRGVALEDVTPKALDVVALLKLPDHLRKTALALDKLGEGTADDVSKITGRKRAIESAYLNQLARMGYVIKRRVGKKVVFTVKT